MAYKETLLWDYQTDNSGTIAYNGQLTLRNNVSNYDELVVEVVSLASDLQNETWHQTCIFEVPVQAVLSKKNSVVNQFDMTTFSNREHYLSISDNIYEIIAGANNTNGVVKIWGVNFNKSEESGGGVIFNNGSFIGSPSGTNMNNYALSTDTSAYRTNKCLYGKFQNRAETWIIENGFIRKNATVTNGTSSGWFIPVGRRKVSKIKVLTKWIATTNTSFNLWNFGVAYIDNNTLQTIYKYSGNGSGTHYSDWTEETFDFSSYNLEYIDYVYVWGCDGSPGFKSIILE